MEAEEEWEEREEMGEHSDTDSTGSLADFIVDDSQVSSEDASSDEPELERTSVRLQAPKRKRAEHAVHVSNGAAARCRRVIASSDESG